MPGVLKRYDAPTQQWVPHIGGGGEEAPLPTLRSVVVETHTYAVEGPITTSKIFVPFRVAKDVNEELRLIGAICQSGGGSGTISVRRNGATLSGLGALSVSTSSLQSAPVNFAMNNGDLIDITLASGSLSNWLSVTIIFKRTSPVSVV